MRPKMNNQYFQFWAAKYNFSKFPDVIEKPAKKQGSKKSR